MCIQSTMYLRYKLFSVSACLGQRLGQELSVIFLYFVRSLVFFKLVSSNSIYLFQFIVHIAFRAVFHHDIGLFNTIKGVYTSIRALNYFGLWLKAASSISIISFVNFKILSINLKPYSHNCILHLFAPLLGLSPVFLLVSLSSVLQTSLVLGLNSFYYDCIYF